MGNPDPSIAFLTCIRRPSEADSEERSPMSSARASKAAAAKPATRQPRTALCKRVAARTAATKAVVATIRLSGGECVGSIRTGMGC